MDVNVRVTLQKKYKVTFVVLQHTATEGGMDVDEYGGEVDTLEKAIVLLEEAIEKENGKWHNWQIVARVT